MMKKRFDLRIVELILFIFDLFYRWVKKRFDLRIVPYLIHFRFILQNDLLYTRKNRNDLRMRNFSFK